MSIMEEIKQFVEGNEVTKRISLDGIAPKERCQIYSAIETNYYDQIQCEKQSEFRGQHRQVVLVLTKRNGTKELKPQPIQIDDNIIDSFCKYTRLSLPLTTLKYINYVLELMDPYTNCQNMFTQFLQDIQVYENLHKLNIRINRVLDDILRHITEHPSTQMYKTDEFEMETNFLKSSIYQTHHKFYTKENQDKLFMSIDINKADYTILKHYHPEIFRNTSTWEEFLRSFFDEKPIQTLIDSKHLRERTFGNAQVTKRTKFLSEYFIHKVLQEMNIKPVDIVMISGDEAVISYDSLIFRSMFDRYHGHFFKVLAFRLVKLPKHDYFVKEYFDPFQTIDNQQIVITRREFKCIPVPFIQQCIKQYQGKTITEMDRKFTTESGHIATFDEPIF